MTAGVAMADSIQGRLGVTGRVGFMVPAENDVDFNNNKTDVGFIGGGGFIYGITDHFAAEIDVTRSTFGSETGDFGVTNVSLGGQYRFALPHHQLVPYLGGGLDILVSDYDPDTSVMFDRPSKADVDTTVGVHASAGVDYFLLKQLALTAEAKLVVAPDTKVTDRLGNRGDFNPTNFSSTVGIRYFFN